LIVEVDEGEFGTKRKGGKGRVLPAKKMVFLIIERTTNLFIAWFTGVGMIHFFFVFVFCLISKLFYFQVTKLL